MAQHTLFARPYGSKRGTPWVRVSCFAYPKSVAVRVYQGALLSSAMGAAHGHELRLRPTEVAVDETATENQARIFGREA
jgi:hypothetical protein